MNLRTRALRAAALTTAVAAAATLTAPTTPAQASTASHRKVDSHDAYWPHGIVGVDESVDSRYPGWVLLTISGHIEPARGASPAPRFSVRCTNALNQGITSANSTYFRGDQVVETGVWVHAGSFYSCGFNRPGFRDDRGFWGRAGR